MTRSPNFDPFADAPDGEEESPEELSTGFPRHRTRELLGEAERGRELREKLAVVALGVAFAAFALALPTRRLCGLMDVFHAGLDDLWGSPWILPGVIVRALEPWLGQERAGFLLAAVCSGLVIPLIDSLGRAHGAELSKRLLALGLVIASPLFWHAATLPGPEAAGALGALVLYRAHRLGSRKSLATVFACLMDPANVLLWLATTRSGRRTPTARAVLPPEGWLIVGILVVSLFLRASPTALREFALAWIAAGGLLAPGFAWLAARGLDREPHGLAWALFPYGPAVLLLLAPVLVISPTWLIGPLYLGALQLGSSRLSVALAAQVGLTVVTTFWLASGDPENDWRATTWPALGPTDCVLEDEPRKAYFMRVRFDVPVVSPGLPEETARRVAAHVAAGRRVLVDRDHRDALWARELALEEHSEHWLRVVDH